ncbi:MAG: hypothetical protein QNL68_16520 [Akkermansiaceae bacterium]
MNGKLQKGSPTAQLYNLAIDSSQGINVIQDHPDRLKAMPTRLKAIGTIHATRPPSP